MKLTVLTILILMLMAGLAMIQMDANTENQIQVTENQIQVLGETEMLTTQGLGHCEYVVNSADQTGNCSAESCTFKRTSGEDSQTVDVYEIKVAVAYNKCSAFNNRNVRDCWDRVKSDGITPAIQRCAYINEYHKPSSSNWSGCHDIYYFTTRDVLVQDVYDVPGCSWNPGGGGGGTVGSTTS